MTAKHQTPEYRRNARIIRERVRTAHRAGGAVPCWRCSRPIVKGQPFDVGHLPHARASALSELAPEHRHATGACPGNRAEGGRQGAQKSNARHTPPTIPGSTTTTWPL